jgi:hypothetical protein
MKYPGLIVLLVLLSASLAHGQHVVQPQRWSHLSASDQSLVDAWKAAATDGGEFRIEEDRIVSAGGEGNDSCAYMRTYRVRREFRGSDITRPAGYLTCVPMAKFRILLKTARPNAPAR